jgi:CheY-like chemotaxis protein
MIENMKNKGRAAEIMLVEDNPGDILLIQKAFKECKTPNHISSAASGEIALAKLRGDTDGPKMQLPDIILMDLNLPQMSGQDVLSILKADPKLKHIPVIILSSSKAEPDVVKSYNLHANGYIVKPSSLDAIKKMVAAIEMFFFELIVMPDGDDQKLL